MRLIFLLDIKDISNQKSDRTTTVWIFNSSFIYLFLCFSPNQLIIILFTSPFFPSRHTLTIRSENPILAAYDSKDIRYPLSQPWKAVTAERMI